MKNVMVAKVVIVLVKVVSIARVVTEFVKVVFPVSLAIQVVTLLVIQGAMIVSLVMVYVKVV